MTISVTNVKFVQLCELSGEKIEMKEIIVEFEYVPVEKVPKYSYPNNYFQIDSFHMVAYSL